MLAQYGLRARCNMTEHLLVDDGDHLSLKLVNLLLAIHLEEGSNPNSVAQRPDESRGRRVEGVVDWKDIVGDVATGQALLTDLDAAAYVDDRIDDADLPLEQLEAIRIAGKACSKQKEQLVVCSSPPRLPNFSRAWTEQQRGLP